MKLGLLPVALCLCWTTPILAADICPTGQILPKCEEYLLKSLKQGKEVVECIRAGQSNQKMDKAKCRERLEAALNELPMNFRPGSDGDTSPANFIQDAIEKL